MTTDSEQTQTAPAGTVTGPVATSNPHSLTEISHHLANPRRTTWNGRASRSTVDQHGRAPRRPAAH